MDRVEITSDQAYAIATARSGANGPVARDVADRLQRILRGTIMPPDRDVEVERLLGQLEDDLRSAS